MLHTHFSVVAAVQVGLTVVIFGTLWRLIALHLAASNNESLTHLGAAMAFQY